MIDSPKIVKQNQSATAAIQALCVAMLIIVGFPTHPVVAQRDDDDVSKSKVNALLNAPKPTRELLQNHCYDCHSGSGAEGGLDLEQLSDQLSDANEERWVRIHDRVSAGEMPPADYGELDANLKNKFVAKTAEWIREVQSREFAADGRVRGRRLTNLQLERTLHDLLAIDVPLISQLPEEPRTQGFTGIATSQSMSHFQLEDHLNVIDLALDAAFDRALSDRESDVTGWTRELSAKDLARDNPRRRNREPEMLNGEAVVWSANTAFYGRLPSTTSRQSGWYRFTLQAKGLKPPSTGTVWCTVRRGKCISNAPMLSWIDAFEFGKEPKTVTFEAWLPAEHMLEIRPGDATLKKGRFRNGQIGVGEGEPQNIPGIAMQEMKVERFYRHSHLQLQRALFGDLQLKRTASENQKLEVVSTEPAKDLARLVRRFAQRAFRHPVDRTAIQPYVQLARTAYQENHDFADALRHTYRALLCSPRFLYFHEESGQLGDYEIASRLSYFLWNRAPDQTLLNLARQGKLNKPEVLRQQVDRMLDDPRGKMFVPDLADQWLDLSEINFTEPDRRMFRTFDPIVQNAMMEETHHFLATMLAENLPVSLLVDSSFTFLNSRLARYYGIDREQPIAGEQMRRVDLQPEDRRGGLITHGSVLKVTANGTTTSPVVRGVWVSERILGESIPSPPANVPAIEPDVRGATTIREMLVKHKSIESCAACHRKIDPPGFALENYDPAGQFRDHYGNPSRGRSGKPVDASGQMPEGASFDGIRDFQKIICSEPERLARNVAEKLLIYGTGSRTRFADREVIDACVEQTREENFGFRSLVKSVVTSETFLSK